MENSAQSVKVSPCKIVEIKIGGKTRFENLLKQLFHSHLVGYEVIITNSRYALVGYFITSYPTRAHGMPGGGYSIYPLVGRCGRAPHTLTLFKTNIADFPTLFKTEFRFLIPCLRHLTPVLINKSL